VKEPSAIYAKKVVGRDSSTHPRNKPKGRDAPWSSLSLHLTAAGRRETNNKGRDILVPRLRAGKGGHTCN